MCETNWMSPLGPMSFVFSTNLAKHSTDETESFNFSLGTTFNMKYFKKITFFWIILIIFQTNLTADVPSYLDFKYILNQSEAGKKAQIF